jgi:protein-disulfide isomerase
MNSDTKIISIIGIITVVVVILGVMLTGASQKANSQLPEITVKPEALVHDDSLRVPSKNAKVQLVEFADFECPACAMLHPALKRILAEYGDKIDYTFRVIPIHQHSVLAASAVMAAREQGKFIQMNDIVFEHQDDWTAYGKTDAQISAMFEQYAGQIGLDVAKYKSDLAASNGKYKATIDKDAADAQSMGIYSTPTGIVNGKPLIRGVVTYEKLKAIIEAELNPQAASTTASAKASAPAATGAGAQSSAAVKAQVQGSVVNAMSSSSAR